MPIIEAYTVSLSMDELPNSFNIWRQAVYEKLENLYLDSDPIEFDHSMCGCDYTQRHPFHINFYHKFYINDKQNGDFVVFNDQWVMDWGHYTEDISEAEVLNFHNILLSLDHMIPPELTMQPFYYQFKEEQLKNMN